MFPHDLNECDPFDITVPDIPKRSRLFALAPIGIGTDRMEGLASYVTRLARAHAVTPWRLLQDEFDKDGKLRGVWELARYKNTLDGLGRTARVMSAIAAELTTIAEVRYLTVLPLADLLSSTGSSLLTKKLRWCPSCFAAMSAEGQEPYRPLVWSFERYNVCHLHKVPLVAACTHCGMKQKFLPDYPDLTHCCHCGCSLAESSVKTNVVRSPSLDLWMADSIGNLVANFPELDGAPIRARFVEYLRDAINDLADGKRGRFFTKIGLYGTSLDSVLFQDGRVRVFRLLALAYAMNVSPSAMLIPGSERPRELRMLPLHLRHELKLCPVTEQRKNQIRDELSCIVADANDTRSGQQVCNALGVGACWMSKWFRTEYSAICTRHKLAITRARVERKAAECEIVKDVVRCLVRRGVFPSIRLVSKAIKPHRLVLVQVGLMETYRRTVMECVSASPGELKPLRVCGCGEVCESSPTLGNLSATQEDL